jgi:hypothetical protein
MFISHHSHEHATPGCFPNAANAAIAEKPISHLLTLDTVPFVLEMISWAAFAD